MSALAKPLIHPNPAKGTGPAVNVEHIHSVSLGGSNNSVADQGGVPSFDIVFSYSEGDRDSSSHIWKYVLKADRDAALVAILAANSTQM
jgi:hypothetical protein